jgi:hypothetical protein
MTTPGSGPPPFLFVVGCGRSGTSVLRRVLDGHSQLAVAHEARFVGPLSRRRARYESGDEFDVAAFAADLLADPAVRGNLGLRPEDVRAALGGAPVVDYPDAVRRVFSYYAARRGKPRYGDKMPAYVLRMPALAELFPEARFVHIIRDGRDVALSTMAIPGRREDAVRLGLEWRRRVEEGRHAGSRLGPTRYCEVRYESLVDDPADDVARLCEFLDLSYEPEMLRFFERPAGTPGKVLANPRHARLAEPLSAGARTWRTDMGGVDVQRFEAVAGDLLAELGYERGAPHPAVGARAAAAWGRVRWHADRARTRLPGMVRRAFGRRGSPSPVPVSE